MAYVALDYGHGSDTFKRRGAKAVKRNGKWYEEHDFNADVGEQVRKILEEHGVKVLVTQEPNKPDRGLKYRTDLANRKGVDAFISFHANAGASAAQGACVFAWEGYKRTNQLADLVVEELKAAGVDTHGNGRHYSTLNSWTNFHVLRETKMSAILIEHGFMTNSRDFENIFGKNSKKYRSECALADARAILRWFGIEFKGNVSKQSKTPEKAPTTPNKESQEELNMKETGFKDVPADAYFAEAVEWAKEEGITLGVGNDEFGVGQAATREQVITFLYRALKDK